MKNESRFFTISAPNSQHFDSQNREKFSAGAAVVSRSGHEAGPNLPGKNVQSFRRGTRREDGIPPFKKQAWNELHTFFGSCFCRLKNGLLDTLDLFS
jgi:hypothetical protein